MSFPKDFIWGASTASYQIEGAYNLDGKGLSIWDVFAKQKDSIWRQHNGDTACDHYHRYQNDICLMKEIGFSHYRFSISWPRIIPDYTGAINNKGLDFYNRLVDELLKADIEPWVTLFHWDYPYYRHCQGGWLNPDSSNWFSDYTRVIVEHLSDRVKNWFTINEPQVFISNGYYTGEFAPGSRLMHRELTQMCHNVLMAHGKAVSTIRSFSKQNCRIGCAPVGTPVKIPVSHSLEDVNAARQAMFSMNKKTYYANIWWMDPIYLGKYPDEGLNLFESEGPDIKSNDMQIINQPLDFFGINIYSGNYVKADENKNPVDLPFHFNQPLTSFKWDITPEALFWGPKFFYERYQKPIIITENGMSNADVISLDGKVHDPQRIDFLARYLIELKKASRNGIPIHGYFHWSFMDNFEWIHGYKERFGLVYVDYKTQNRILKDSAYWYKEVISSNCENL